MPSLQQLKEFASSFRNLGDEVVNTPKYEEFPLPETEPAEPFPDALITAGGTGAQAADDSGDDEADFSFGDFLDEPAENDFTESAAGEPDETVPPDTGAFAEKPAETGGGLPDFDDLFGGMAQDLAAASADLPIPQADLDEPQMPEASVETAAEAGDEAAPDTAAADEPDSIDLGDIGLDGGQETGAAFTEEAPGRSDISDSGFDDEPALVEELEDADDDFLNKQNEDETTTAPPGEEPAGDLGGEQAGGEESMGDFSGIEGIEGIETPAEAGDAFDNFSPEAGAEGVPASGESPQDVFGDFSLAGLDSGLAGIAAAEPGIDVAPEEEVEEISLSEDDFRSLQETLSGYPLNLRIACEEIIAEQAVNPKLMSALIKLLTRGAPPKETASLAGKILDRTIPLPKGAGKQTGADFEAEQASFGYIFVKKFLPILRILILAGMVLFVTGYLCWRFIINPVIANGIYKDGYERIGEGDYSRANDLFMTAFKRHKVKNWFYRYAEAFREMRQYQAAERKYDELLRVYPRDKKGALDYAAMETHNLKNYQKADRIIRNNILDYAVDDREGLIALAENNLAWGEEDPSRYEEARAVYSRLIARYGRQDPFLEGMLIYFIRTDKLNEVLPLQTYFMSNPKKRKITVPTLAELGGYLLDKHFEDERGIPDEYADRIEGIQDILLRAVKDNPGYPESYYHLSRYYNNINSKNEERVMLESALRAFEAAPEINANRAAYKVDSYRRYAEVLITGKEFFPAEEQLTRGIRSYEDARARGVLKSAPIFGRLYADLGDLAFFTQSGDMEAALRYYRTAEANGWSPPEVQYRMGAAHYEMEQWEDALGRFFALSELEPRNRRLLYALANTAYLRGDYYAAQSYYNRLMEILDGERVRFPNLAPGSRPEAQDFAERIMVANNNLGVTLEALTRVSGNQSYRSRALGLLAESTRAWDVLTRNPETMTRMRPAAGLYGPGINLAYLNTQNILHPIPGYEQQIFMRIDRDMPEPSAWELLVPRDYRLSENLYQE